MAASKAAHFEALSATTAPDDERRGPRLARAAQRAARLAEHDACVQRFKTEIRALAATDASAHRALTAAIAAHAAQIVESDA
ncbi:MAG: hypothetical protein H6977_01425 [Gammaproteobacteria bacterium]|nr:hypothetical protein [Gammaproteobacteria bacterium]